MNQIGNNDKIINSAKQLFSEKGYAATGIREIAEKAGVSLGNFYNYYKNKEELFHSLIDPENIINSLSNVPGLIGEGFPNNFDKLIYEIKQVVDANFELYRLIFIDLTEFKGYNTNRIIERLIGFANVVFSEEIKSRIVGKKIKDVDYAFHIKAFIIATISIFVVSRVLPSAAIESYDDRQIASQLSEVLLRGILV